MSLSERFQITVPAKDEAGEPWVDADSQRVHSGNTMPLPNFKFNVMPVGYDATSPRDRFVKGFGGDTDVSDGLSAQSLAVGFNPVPMKGTDDQYTGEHVDLWYGDTGGFVERNNYLDRE